MVVEVLDRHGRSDATTGWLDEYTKRLEPAPSPRWAIEPDDWREALGDSIRLGDWLDLFETQCRERPWRDVLVEWWPRLAPRRGRIGDARHHPDRARASCPPDQGDRLAVTSLPSPSGTGRPAFNPCPPRRKHGRAPRAGAGARGTASHRRSRGGARTRSAQLADLRPGPTRSRRCAGPPTSSKCRWSSTPGGSCGRPVPRLWHGPIRSCSCTPPRRRRRPRAAALPCLPPELWQLTLGRGLERLCCDHQLLRNGHGQGRALASLTPEEVFDRAVENGGAHVIKFTDVAVLAHDRGVCCGALGGDARRLARLPWS